MVQTCSRCSRANPPEALYCYFDGAVLGDHTSNGGPVHTGTQPFHHQFTFPSGRVCRNFDQLALACQEHWAEAVELLQQGYLENFLAGLGRADLALAAQEAARFPDPDRGLDQFLAKLPSDVIVPPKLLVEPTEVHLGQLQVGEDRELELHLSNQGMRLLYGSVACVDCVWLAVGEGAGSPHKLFQFGGELVIPVRVRGKHLRAENKPLEGRLLVETNAGTVTVMVRADVPVEPFPEGIFAGARTPRQIADKAKAHLKINLKETAAPFENGAVARWYQDNGWTYPVQGPVAEGAAAVQQFFDALGLSRPPRVELSATAITLQGNVGVQLRHVLEIRAQERRPIYAYGTSDQPWLEVGRGRLDGRTATLALPLVVPSVPDHEGQTLTARVTVIANGNQRFTVPVTLEVGGSFYFNQTQPRVPAAETNLTPTAAAPTMTAATPVPESAPPAPPAAVETEHRAGRRWPHAVPAGLLVLALVGVVAYDRVQVNPSASEEEVQSRSGMFDDPEPRLGIKFDSRMRFGIVMLKERDPNNPARFKRLTAKEDGWSNNTCVRLDGEGHLFGTPPVGEWAQTKRFESLKQVPLGRDRHGWMSTWVYPRRNVRVRQTVEIIPNEQTRLLDTCLIHYLVENHDTIPHKVGIRVMLDTFIGSNDGVPFVIPGRAGLLETMQVFDQKNIPDYIEALENPDPANPSTIAHMGLKLHTVRIRPRDPDLEPLEKLVICRWPGTSEKRWDWEYKAMNDSGQTDRIAQVLAAQGVASPGSPSSVIPQAAVALGVAAFSASALMNDPPEEKNDSCVVLYWEDRPMEPGTRRAMAFTYGLGRISSSSDGKLGITVGGSFQPGGVFTVTAYVKDPVPGQKIKLSLPRGLSLALGEEGHEQANEQVVDQAAEYSQVSWRVRGDSEGLHTLEVSSGLERQIYKVRIRKQGLFD